MILAPLDHSFFAPLRELAVDLPPRCFVTISYGFRFDNAGNVDSCEVNAGLMHGREVVQVWWHRTPTEIASEARAWLATVEGRKKLADDASCSSGAPVSSSCGGTP